MAVRSRSWCAQFVRLLLSFSVLISVVIIASLGGFLNRCRGGYVQYGKHMSYWPAHVISRQTFSLSTGLLVLTFGCHLRAAVVVWLLTQWSLYVGWGTYMMIGEVPTDFESLEGVFDWMLGRQEVDWNFTHRFVREYTGMSLRGLVWTAPQGFALQQLGFGWQYSLSGSLMSIVYFAGGRSHIPKGKPLSDYFDGAIPFSEFYWGTFIWFVLIISCLTQIVYRMRKWVFSQSPTNTLDPNKRFEVFKYESLNHNITSLLYNIFFAVFWLILAASTCFYSLVVQKDLDNKGQTFFGLFVAVLALTIFLTWTWSYAYAQRILKKHRKQNLKLSPPINRRIPARINEVDYFEQRSIPGFFEPSETDRLLPWPYSHPDKGFATDSRSHRSENPNPLGFNSGSPAMPRSSSPLHHTHVVPKKPLPPAFNCIVKSWMFIENWVYIDIFVLIRHSIGLLSLVSVFTTITLCCISVAWDSHSPTFDPKYYVCVNESVWNNTML